VRPHLQRFEKENIMRISALASIAAGLALLAGCKEQDTGNRTAPAGSAAGSPTRTTGGSSDYTVPKRADNNLDQAKSAQAPANSPDKDALKTGDSSQGAKQSVNGTIAQVSTDEVRVDSANQPGLRLKVNPATKITVNGKDASATQLQEGSQVRASYAVVGDQPTALTIEVRSAAQ
jgi:hypothetical protein